MSATSPPFEILKQDLLEYFNIQALLDEAGSTPVCDLPPLVWAEAYRRIEGRPFSLDYRPATAEEPARGYEPLKQIYDDDHPFIVIMKPAQVGLSELAISRALHALDVGARYWKTSNDGLNVGYLFPTQDALYDFSKERISGIKDESDKLGDFFTDFDDVGFKKAGHSYFYIRGAWSTKALKSFKADLLIFDEYDEMLPRAVALAVKRLRHSQVKRQIRLSTPTLPNKGIHESYLQSDQQEWEVHCSGCDGWNSLDFFRDVKVEGADYEEWKEREEESIHRSTITVACPSCRQTLSDDDRFGPGRWVARRPEITRIRGYHVPALCFPSVSLSELAIAAISTDPEQVTEFYRSDLGVPYTPKDSAVTDEMLKQLSVSLPNGMLPAGVVWRDGTLGVDGGKRYHYRVSGTGPDGRRYVLAMGALTHDEDRGIFEKLDELMERFHVRQAVIDGSYDPTAIKAWADKHRGRVRRAFYPNTDFKGEMFRLPGSEEKKMHGVAVKKADPLKVEDTVQINRDMAMDAVYSMVATASEVWPASIHNDPEVVVHMKAPTRVMVKNQEGQEMPKWVHKNRDDLFHACVYDLVARLTLPQPTRTGGIMVSGVRNPKLG
ncbi:MAG TPA: terminase gpA endonuclease subunit [Pyrinomonadaceae bacterium]|jgi:hypothetical protein